MEWKNEIVTQTLPVESIWVDLRGLIQRLEKYDIGSIEVLFGFAWGNYFLNWQPLNISPRSLEKEIRKAEEQEAGELGDHDLFITVKEFDLHIQYCHESDIHLSYNETNIFVEETVNSWENSSWELLRYQNDPKK